MPFYALNGKNYRKSTGSERERELVKEGGRAMGKEGSVNTQNNRKALKNRNNRLILQEK